MMKTRLARTVSRVLARSTTTLLTKYQQVVKLGIASTIARSSATSLRTLFAVSVATPDIWLATVLTAREALIGIMPAFLAMARSLLAQVMLSTVRWR